MSLAPTVHFALRGYDVRGVVHVGAHEGQEIPEYLRMGHVPIIAFEPNPAAAARIAERFAAERRAGQLYVSFAALGEESGRAQLWIPRRLHDGGDDEQSASLLRADHDSPYPWGERDVVGREIEVPIWRFDEWLRTGADIRPTHFMPQINALVIDVQGYELQVLRGFGDEIDGFDFICVECSEVPIYKSGAPATAVVDLLEQHGFRLDSPILGHDDVFFVRKGL